MELHYFPIKKILLATDAYAADPGLNLTSVVRALRPFLREGVSVEPTYIMTPGGVDVPRKQFPQWLDHYRAQAKVRMRAALQTELETALGEMTVLPHGDESIRSAVDLLLAHAHSEHANMIALSTHARSGINRLILGSFAETLLFKSLVPLFICNPDVRSNFSAATVLYPTDLSEESVAGFSKVIDVAKQLHAKLILFHVVQSYFRLTPPPGLIGAPVPYDDREAAEEQMRSMISLAERAGVRAEIDITTTVESAAATIVAASEKHRASLIALSTRTTEGLAVGSIPRQIIRMTDRPVLTLPCVS